MQPHLPTAVTIKPAQEFEAQQSVSKQAWVASPQLASAGARNVGLDALRASLTLLVVMHHTAITYGAIGGWFYREVSTDRSLSSTLLVYFCTVNQAFFMGLFFLLAGYLTPGAVERHGTRRYAIDRFKRLGLPLLFFGWLLGPVTIAMAQTARGHAFADTLVKLLRDGTFENGPLWFAQALLIFACVAMLWLKLTPRLQQLWPGQGEIAPWPSNVAMLGAATVTGAVALVLRVFWPVGVNVWGLQLGYFSSYVVLFAFGCFAARHHWLEFLPADKVRTWWRVALLALPTLPIVYFLGRAVPGLREPVLGYVYAFWEPIVAWGVILKLLWEFQRKFTVLDGLWKSLVRRAYTIFIIHPPVLVAVALAWRGVPTNGLVKFAVTGTVTCALCFIFAGWLLRVPALRKIL
ncbi:surface polysaccharide O-acyltransferase-like enzyme [Variovorax sp. GrIS 2.14]|uniref:acyltransferase family protein n=1 Tax=Variovorax sp. GrIS 2.14 TaxID=3071709 RepID=UPI0038F60B28